MVYLVFPVVVVLLCVLHLLVLILLQDCWHEGQLLVLRLLLELVVLDSVSSSWSVERVSVVQSVCIRLVGKCDSESICPLLQYILGKST